MKPWSEILHSKSRCRMFSLILDFLLSYFQYIIYNTQSVALCCCCRLISHFFVFSWSLFCFLVFIYRSWAVFYGLCRLYCFCRYIFSLSFSRFTTILQIKSILFVICVSRLWFHGWFHLAQEMLFLDVSFQSFFALLSVENLHFT